MENNYNEFNKFNDYNPYTNPSSENSGGNSEKKKTFEGFGVTLTKCIAIALVFGLVAGTAFTAVSYFSGNALFVFAEEDDSDDIYNKYYNKNG